MMPNDWDVLPTWEVLPNRPVTRITTEHLVIMESVAGQLRGVWGSLPADVVDDMLATARLRVLERYETFNPGRGEFGPWCRSVMYHACVSSARTPAALEAIVTEADLPRPPGSDDADVLTSVAAPAESDVPGQVACTLFLSTLTEDDQLLVELYLNGYTQPEVQARTGLTVRQQETRRARLVRQAEAWGLARAKRTR